MAKFKTINSENAPRAVWHYSLGLIPLAPGLPVYLSGVLPIDTELQIVSTDVQEQAKQVFRNIEEILKAEGLSFQDVVKVTVYMKNMTDFQIVNEVYAGVFGDHKPARSTVEVARLPKDALVEVDVIAWKTGTNVEV